MLPDQARNRTLAERAYGVIRAVVVGWFIVFSLLGNQTAVALGARTTASPTPNRSAPTEEEEHGGRIETAQAKTGVRLFRRKALSRPVPHARAFILPNLQTSFSALNSRAVAPPASEHAMRNSIGAPLRC